VVGSDGDIERTHTIRTKHQRPVYLVAVDNDDDAPVPDRISIRSEAGCTAKAAV